MPSHYACHAGMLLYVSEQFRDAALAEHDPRFGAYADMLDRIVGDLMGRDDSEQAAVNGRGRPADRVVGQGSGVAASRSK